MDTISSRESNTNFLPMAGVVIGAVALILAIVAFVKLAGVSKDVNEIKNISARVDSLESQLAQVGQFGQFAQDAKSVASDAKTSVVNLATQTQTGFNNIGTALEKVNARLDRIETARPGVRPAPAGGAVRGAAPVAGPGEYKVKSGDTGAKIASANGVKLSDLMAVNPDVNWNRMHVGQTIKLPAKAGAQPAQQQAQPNQ